MECKSVKSSASDAPPKFRKIGPSEASSGSDASTGKDKGKNAEVGVENPVNPPGLPLTNGNTSGMNWSLGTLIARGQRGTVYMGLDTDKARCVAIKVVRGCHENSARSASLIQEVEFMKGLRHPNIVKYYGTGKLGNDYYILMEYCSSGSIAQLVRRKALTEAITKGYTSQVLKGLHFLHQNGVIHRDIKGSNILVNGNGNAKLSDFGTATIFEKDREVRTTQEELGLAGSAYWMAPEVVVHGTHYAASDVWSLGCTIIEMLTGSRPYAGLDVFKAFIAIADCSQLPTLPETYSSVTVQCRAFLNRCLVWDHTKRATVEELLQHEWLSLERPMAPVRVLSQDDIALATPLAETRLYLQI